MRINRLKSGMYQVRWSIYVKRKRVQRARNFRTKELAQAHCRELDRGEHQEPDGETVEELTRQYRESQTWKNLDEPTQILYSNLFRRWFDGLDGVALKELTPARVSEWIAWMKENVDRYGNASQRKSFTKELSLLKALLTWYEGYKTDDRFVTPVKKRHEEEVWLESAFVRTSEDFEGQVSDEIPLTEEEFLRWRIELGQGKFGEIMQILADTQYDHVLRISEVAAGMWTDVRWQAQEIKWQRHVQYVHQGREKHRDKIVPGLKNRKTLKRKGKRFKKRKLLSKVTPFFPRSTAGLKKLYLAAEDKTGLIFKNPETGDFFTYKCIVDKYNRAFKRAGLPYRGSHIVRYGGVNKFIEEFDADEDVGMELLGNESEGRYILRRPSKVSRALKRKEPSASEVHSALEGSKTVSKDSRIDEGGGMDGKPLAV